MKRRRAGLLCAAAWLAAAAAAPVRPAASQKKRAAVVLSPRLVKGQSLRYEIAFHSTSKSSTESVIQDPGASAGEELSFRIRLRLEVLEVQAQAGGSGAASVAGARPAVRLRVTYEQVAAKQGSDDPAGMTGNTQEAAQRLAALEGKSFECALDPGGASECSGGVADVPGAAEGLQGWLTQIFGARGIPEKGIAPGERWGDEQEAGGAIPLAGLRWVRQFTYMGNEPCQAGAAAADAPGEACAVVRARSLLIRKGGRKNATPGAFREKGLRTAGTARGANESLTRFSLANGMVVSAAEAGWQTTDVTVSTADGERKIRTTTDLKTNTTLTLLRNLP